MPTPTPHPAATPNQTQAPPVDTDRMIEANLGDEADIINSSPDTPPDLSPASPVDRSSSRSREKH
ncbi:hypothetical protein [Chitinimonas lacunae]|uniref:MatE family transporter n=1 Tax=Chitinimonas lacunae TaxID=1963018 RepID=A0ABV8MMY6_9NEIS